MYICTVAHLATNLLTLVAKALQLNKTDVTYIAKFCIYIMTVMLLLMTGNASSGVIDDIKADMQLNEAPLFNAPVGPSWTKKAVIVMGNAPRGDATPTWYTPTNLKYKSATPWNAITPWFVIYPGVSHAARNVRVELSGITIYILKKSNNQWVRMSTTVGNPTWAANWNFDLSGSGTLGQNIPRLEPDGKLSYKLRPEFYPIHGGIPGMSFTSFGIDPIDVAAVFAQIKTQLILDNPAGVDDRASAQILVSIGADYSLTETTNVSDFSPTSDAPIKAVGGSRFGLVKATQRNHYMATIDPPGAFKSISEYTQNGGVIAIPADEFEVNLPPHLLDTISPSAPTSLNLIFNKPTRTAWASNSLSWKESTDNVAVLGYNIYRNGSKIAATTSNNYKDSFPTAGTGTLYSYTVKAFDDAGNLSTSSNVVLTVY